VMSSSSMKVATLTANSVHHLRCISVCLPSIRQVTLSGDFIKLPDEKVKLPDECPSNRSVRHPERCPPS
jgi:hypothetical protein